MIERKREIKKERERERRGGRGRGARKRKREKRNRERERVKERSKETKNERKGLFLSSIRVLVSVGQSESRNQLFTISYISTLPYLLTHQKLNCVSKFKEFNSLISYILQNISLS